jgi:hypothetical protein
MLLRFYEIGVHSLVRNTALLAKPDANVAVRSSPIQACANRAQKIALNDFL